MKTSILLSLFAIVALLSGCATSNPIKTDLNVGTEPFGFNYSSEKDVLYERNVTNEDGTTENVSFKALASAAALAQAERDKVQAEANKAQAESLSSAIQSLAPLIKPED